MIIFNLEKNLKNECKYICNKKLIINEGRKILLYILIRLYKLKCSVLRKGDYAFHNH